MARNSRTSGILTEKQQVFIAAFRGNAVAAARAAGYSDPVNSAYQLMNNPIIQYHIQRKQVAMSEESAKLWARELTFCRNDILNRMWEMANLPHQQKEVSFETQLKAMQSLAEIFDTGLARTAELARLMEGKSPEEIEYLTMHGHFPGENSDE
jgi:Terminase small subunit